MPCKLGCMARYHFHVFDGHSYHWDTEGMMLPDLAAVVAEAERRARSVIDSRSRAQDWTGWIVDVRGNDDITLFHYPFTEIADDADSEEQSAND
jgi:hypothetical protein